MNFKTANGTYCRSGKYLFGQVYVFEPCSLKKKRNEKETLDHLGPPTQREFKTIVSPFVFSITGLKQLAQISTSLVPPPCNWGQPCSLSSQIS